MTSFDQKVTIELFLDATAARQPTPGGGAVTALTAALAAAMGEMVIQYSIGKKGLEAYAGELRPVLSQFHRAREILVQLMAEDQSAYAAFSLAKKLPDGSAERAAQFPLALQACIRVPQAIAATAVSMLELSDRIINFVNPHLLSDLAVCCDLAMATARCAAYSVRANMCDVSDPLERQHNEATVTQLLSRAAGLIQKVAPRIWARHSQETLHA